VAVKKVTPAPRRAGIGERFDARRVQWILRELKAAHPDRYERLMAMARSAVEKKSTKQLTRRSR
jgi:hypothetical protein